MNSSADIKGFVGLTGGVVCTSSNAKRALTWAFERGEKVFFLPDQHLGRNTAITVDPDTAHHARAALDQMLALP
jgi:quinolinate synthase